MVEVLQIMSTMEDIYNLPEGERAELIDGELYMMACPGRRHQRAVARAFNQIYNHININHGSCEVNVAPFAVFLFDDNTTYVEPDICVVCDPEKLDEKGCHGAPDWMIEVLSPSTQSRDCLLKLLKYQNARVREYWIVESEQERVTVYNFEKEEVTSYSFEDQIPTEICKGLTLDFKGISLG